MLSRVDPSGSRAHAGFSSPSRSGRLRRFDVTKYGAKGDGRDDWAAIKAAVRAMPTENAVLYFPAARSFYNLGNHAEGINLHGKRNIRIEAAGWTSRIKLSVRGTRPVAYIFANIGDGVTFDGIHIDCSGAANTIGLHVNGNQVEIRNSYLAGCRAGSVSIGNRREISIRNNYFYGAGYGVLTQHSGSASELTITGNYFNGTDRGEGEGSDAIEINSPAGNQTNVDIIGNFIENYTKTDGSGIGIGLAHVRNANVAWNYIRNCGLAGIHIEDGSADVTVDRNVITDCPGDGIQIISGTNRVVTNVSVTNNLVRRCATGAGRFGIMIGGVVGSANIIIDANRVESCGREGGRTIGISTGYKPVNVIVSNNTVSNLLGAEVIGIEPGGARAVGNRVCGDRAGRNALLPPCD